MLNLSQEEFHAWVIGVAETLCPIRARYRITRKAEFGVKKEYHYYVWGRVCGFLTWIPIVYGVWRLFNG